jgi:Peptide methionine sulfoxide reductase
MLSAVARLCRDAAAHAVTAAGSVDDPPRRQRERPRGEVAPVNRPPAVMTRDMPTRSRFGLTRRGSATTTLVEAFWAIQNPTTRNRHGLDSGSQYRGRSSSTTPTKPARPVHCSASTRSSCAKQSSLRSSPRGEISGVAAPIIRVFARRSRHEDAAIAAPRRAALRGREVVRRRGRRSGRTPNGRMARAHPWPCDSAGPPVRATSGRRSATRRGLGIPAKPTKQLRARRRVRRHRISICGG